MAESYVQVQPDSTGKKLRTYEHAVGANTVHEEVMQVAKADGTKINPAQEDGNLATIAGDTTSIDGKITACNTGAVTVSAALPAGVNAIGKLAANSGVDIGDVDVTSVVPGVAAASLGKAEDAAHQTGDTGVAILGVRNDTPTSLVNGDLDYTPIAVDEYGRVKTIPIPVTFGVARIDTAAAAQVEVVAAQGAGNKIYVVGYQLQAHGTTIGHFESANTDISPEWTFQAREGVVCAPIDFDPLKKRCYFVTAANEALNFTNSAAVLVTGNVQYVVST